MGKLNQGPFQGFIGKTGGLVGKRWKGKYVVSAYQPSVSNPKSSKQQEQRNIFQKAVSSVTEFINAEKRLYLSTGFTGTTVNASNIGFVSRMYRQMAYAAMAKDVSRRLDYIPRGAMCSGFDNFGNTILDNLDLTQVLTTSSFAVTFKVTTGFKYFGSDIDLSDLQVVASLTTDGENVSYNEVSMDLVDSLVDPTLPKVYGFQDTAKDCGNWPFVYKTNPEAIVSTIGGIAVTSKVQGAILNECFANVGFYSKSGVVISSRWLYLTITIV